MKQWLMVLVVTTLYSQNGLSVIRFSDPNDVKAQEIKSPPSKIQGARTSFSATRPEISGLRCRKKSYPKEITGAQLKGDWLFTPWTSYGFDMGFMATTGNPLQWADSTNQGNSITDADCDQFIASDEISKLTMIPLGVHTGVRFSPFDRRYIGLSAWLGYEEMYFQEVRSPGEESSSGTPSINTGWVGAMKAGASVDFLINFLDQKTASALGYTTDFRFIYVSLFSEIHTDLGSDRLLITTRKNSPVSFARQTYGLSFIFET